MSGKKNPDGDLCLISYFPQRFWFFLINFTKDNDTSQGFGCCNCCPCTHEIDTAMKTGGSGEPFRKFLRWILLVETFHFLFRDLQWRESQMQACYWPLFLRFFGRRGSCHFPCTPNLSPEKQCAKPFKKIGKGDSFILSTPSPTYFKTSSRAWSS